jgi:methylated-DNA-[protein]-cysteine S-methyltransferase
MTMSASFSLFNTSIGFCGIAWGVNGIVGVQLPETAGMEQTRARLAKLFAQYEEASPPAQVGEAIARITGLLSGQLDDLQDIPLGKRRFIQQSSQPL